MIVLIKDTEQLLQLSSTLSSESQKPADALDVRYKQVGGGSKAAYLPNDTVIANANRIFGGGGWSSRILECRVEYCDASTSGAFSVGCSAHIRITLKNGAFREDIGFCSSENQRQKAKAIEVSRKGAVSDGIKRCLRQFGDALGNCLRAPEYIKRTREMQRRSVEERTRAASGVGTADAGQGFSARSAPQPMPEYRRNGASAPEPPYGSSRASDTGKSDAPFGSPSLGIAGGAAPIMTRGMEQRHHLGQTSRGPASAANRPPSARAIGTPDPTNPPRKELTSRGSSSSSSETISTSRGEGEDRDDDDGGGGEDGGIRIVDLDAAAVLVMSQAAREAEEHYAVAALQSEADGGSGNSGLPHGQGTTDEADDVDASLVNLSLPEEMETDPDADVLDQILAQADSPAQAKSAPSRDLAKEAPVRPKLPLGASSVANRSPNASTEKAASRLDCEVDGGLSESLHCGALAGSGSGSGSAEGSLSPGQREAMLRRRDAAIRRKREREAGSDVGAGSISGNGAASAGAGVSQASGGSARSPKRVRAA